jgi:uncharacterized protein YprB with RNaseH-like and TPR domain
MLRNTFCHIPGITLRQEKQLWDSGVHCWDQSEAFNSEAVRELSRHCERSVKDVLMESAFALKAGDVRYFNTLLPTDQMWRLFPEFRPQIAYLDIETTGIGRNSLITTVAIYDGQRVRHYVQGRNLQDFTRDIHDYELIVSYNGKAFDVPFIERFFGIELGHPHIDLMYVLRSLGITGGLKGCERKMGLDRGDLEGVDGYFAVLLWREYQKRKNEKALETLLAYNIQDVLNLETLLVMAYNLKLKATPFARSHTLPLPEYQANPFRPDEATVQRVRLTDRRTWNA